MNTDFYIDILIRFWAVSLKGKIFDYNYGNENSGGAESVV